MSLELRPTTLRAARQWVEDYHRHNVPPRGWKFGVAAFDGEKQVGVGIAGRPVARALDDGTTIEVLRVCTDGTRNACSLLYGALARAAKALGYRKIITYTLQSEPGDSLRASAFVEADRLRARDGGWDTPSRPRDSSLTPNEAKIRWEREL